MIIISHRGNTETGRGRYENSWEAFESAVEIGADGIETDLQVSRDGRAILFHDRTLDGTSVSHLTHAELERRVGHAVPTLEEAICRWNKVLWNIELKAPEAIGRLIEIVRKYESRQEFIVTSFWHHLMPKCAKMLAVDCGLIVMRWPFSLRGFISECVNGRNNLNTIVWHYKRLDQSSVERAASCGIKNLAFDVCKQEEFQRCRGLGLDGIITDCPERGFCED